MTYRFVAFMNTNRPWGSVTATGRRLYGRVVHDWLSRRGLEWWNSEVVAPRSDVPLQVLEQQALILGWNAGTPPAHKNTPYWKKINLLIRLRRFFSSQ
jgi:hypothetical protein